MTKRSFVIGEFISDMSHEAWMKLMPCGSRKNERVNDLAFVIGEFISDMSHEAWIKLMPCWSRKK